MVILVETKGETLESFQHEEMSKRGCTLMKAEDTM